MPRARTVLRSLTAPLVCLLASYAHTEWEIRPDLNVGFLRGRVEPWFAPEGSGRDWRGEIDFVADGLFAREYGSKTRFVQLGVGVASYEGWHRGTIGAEPEQTSARLTADGDLPVGDHPQRRWTLGVLVESRSNEVGGINVDSGTSTVPALMYTWKTAGSCELNTATVFYEVESVDDKSNPGHPLLDRGGTYRAGGAEVSMVLGEIPPGFACERLGPYRQIDSYRNISLHVGSWFGDDSTAGSEFVAERLIVYGRGWVPLWPQAYERTPRRPAPDVFEWRLELGRADFSDVDGRSDDSVLLEVGARWGFVKRGKWPHWIKNFDLNVAVNGARRNSTVERFEHDELGLFVGLWMRFSRDAHGEPGVQGSVAVRRRAAPGRSTPRVLADLGSDSRSRPQFGRHPYSTLVLVGVGGPSRRWAVPGGIR